MDLKISTDPKTVKMLRRLEKFLDSDVLKGKELLDFKNAETGRVFAVFLTPAALQKVSDYIDAQEAELNEALDTIEVLEDIVALLDIIDSQNEVLMGRVSVESDAEIERLTAKVEQRARDENFWHQRANDLAEERNSLAVKADLHYEWALHYLNLCREDRGLPPFDGALEDLFPKPEERIAFTADAHRDGDYNGRFGWPICD